MFSADYKMTFCHDIYYICSYIDIHVYQRVIFCHGVVPRGSVPRYNIFHDTNAATHFHNTYDVKVIRYLHNTFTGRGRLARACLPIQSGAQVVSVISLQLAKMRYSNVGARCYFERSARRWRRRRRRVCCKLFFVFSITLFYSYSLNRKRNPSVLKCTVAVASTI